jgi:hypothetical protein
VPLNSPRLLIRLRVCRKSGTVPLNSPRLLIQHWIPSTGLHTDINTKLQEESISRPTRTYYAIQNHQVLQDQGQLDLYGRRKSGGLQSTNHSWDPKTSTRTNSSINYHRHQMLITNTSINPRLTLRFYRHY